MYASHHWKDSIMIKRVLLLVVIMLFVLSVSSWAEPDSLWIGDLNAYYMGNSVFKVPLFYSNDSILNSFGFPFMFATTGGPILPDSITRAGRSYGQNYFDLFMGFGYEGSGSIVDSACAGLVSSGNIVPPGDGVIADIWFSGGQIGDLVSFTPIEFYPPACYVNVYPLDPDGGPVFVPTAVVIVEGVTEIGCLDSFTVQATRHLSFDIYVTGPASPFSLEIVSLTGPATQTLPYLSGSDPWTCHWQPAFNEVGEYNLLLRATDAEGSTVERSVAITVTELQINPCDVARGDLNCDGKVDIADMIFMVDWTFNNGPAPYCK